MLEKLKEKILEKFPDDKSKADGRGIIFVQTRELTTALCRWIGEDVDLKYWNPEILVGANAKDPGPGKFFCNYGLHTPHIEITRILLTFSSPGDYDTNHG
jgi:hypothetical protein